MNEYDSLWGQESDHAFAPKLSHESAKLFRSTLGDYNCNCEEWVTKLASSFNEADNCADWNAKKTRAQKTILFWIRKLFSNLRIIVDQFNSAAAHEYMWIECSEPQFHTVKCNERYTERSYETSKIYFEGHLATRDYTLLVRGLGVFARCCVLSN